MNMIHYMNMDGIFVINLTQSPRHIIKVPFYP